MWFSYHLSTNLGQKPLTAHLVTDRMLALKQRYSFILSPAKSFICICKKISWFSWWILKGVMSVSVKKILNLVTHNKKLAWWLKGKCHRANIMGIAISKPRLGIYIYNIRHTDQCLLPTLISFQKYKHYLFQSLKYVNIIIFLLR